MFDLFAMLLSSITSFLFPIFASYKALKTSDPAQLTPWLMYWVVFSCCILVESWVSFILFWIPFYGYVRLLFLLYLILPQTQGARTLYEEYIHPFLEENEGHIDEFIASAHDRLKAAGIAYLRQAIEYVKTNVLGLPPSEPAPAAAPEPPSTQTYTQALLARFSVPSTRWSASTNANGDFYNLLAGAVSALSTAGARSDPSGPSAPGASGLAQLIPANLRNPNERMSFIAAQRERLSILLSALDREAQELQRSESQDRRVPSMAYDGHDEDEPTQRPPSGLSGWSGLSKSRSEPDFEKIDAESGAEDNDSLRRRNVAGGTPSAGGTSWVPWTWGTGASEGASSGMEH
ncbi:TB2/DP1, HVA22 family-domain-containing protein [Stachybotrys elegans]|uniref:Protein YOP1 n=1 Tax=Stachybotrys elegans TaxID=80388 RepID=A0A8K0SLD0_9HYPO|nr:TB2/DP1, HVA22 family-domain-containing protein [Stachybotrys elegans]